MKIAINGTILDTDNIYEIGPIEVDIWGELQAWYKIISFNGKGRTMRVELHCSYYDHHSIVRVPGGTIEKHPDGALEDCINSDIYKSQLKKLQKHRDDVIVVWNPDQNSIPQINLK